MKTMEEEEEDGETYRGGLGAVEEAAVVGECAAGEAAREAAGEPHLRPLPFFFFWVILIRAITILQVWRSAITIHVFGLTPLQFSFY